MGKKKLSLKPVARGFATTSIPKKAVPEPLKEEEDAEKKVESTIDASSGDAGPSTSNGTGASSANSKEVKSDWDPEKAHWQAFVDKFQEKTEKEINRTVKVVEYDRRFAKTFSRIDIDPVLRDRILALAKEESMQNAGAVKSRPAFVDDAEDKILARLANTYGVLRRLGFSEERVEACLKTIDGVDLDEAVDWLYLYCDEEELVFDKNEVDTSESSRTPRTPKSGTFPQPSIPPTPSIPSSFSSSIPQDTVPTPSSATDESSASTSAVDVNKQRILASYGNNSEMSSTTSTSSGRSSPEDPNVEWARTKVKWTVESKRRPLNAQVVAELKTKMERVKADYFFKQKDADALFKAEWVAYEKAALEDRLRSGALDGASRSSEGPRAIESKSTHARKPSRLQLQLKEERSSTPAVDVLSSATENDRSDDEGMFGTFLDEMPTSEVDSNSNVLIQIRDMALPKHFSGRTPKKLLEETVQKLDRYAAVSYRAISGSSRAARAGVTIIREGKRTQEWDMIDVGCHTMEQAEQYIATVALHASTFVPQAGFASAGPNASIQTYFRLLPPIFRDLWDELEAKRKESEDETNRQTWAKLKEILEPKLGSLTKSTSKASKLATPETTNGEAEQPSAIALSLSEQLSMSFQARQASAAFQDMKAQRDMLPIAAYRNTILEALDNSQVIVLSGETGCGKSTQLPSFILEDQLLRGIPAKIFCTEPRRISAISLAQRVSRELGEPVGAVGTNASLVGYSIRLESNTSRNTRLTFCTNGIALRMLEGGSGQSGRGSAFDEVTHIIIDEVHERTIESDFLLIVLKSLLEQRTDLKVILMSATLDAEKISAFFGGCPTLHVPGRTYPVSTRYLEDAVEATGWFVKNDSQYAKRLNDKYHRSGKQSRMEWNEDTVGDDDDDTTDSTQQTQPVKWEKRYSAPTIETINNLDERIIPYDLIIRLLEKVCYDEQYIAFSAATLIFMPGINEIRRLNEALADHDSFGNGDAFKIYPLHSSISTENQGAVFDIPPPGVRKIVIATNIAETGITIPDVTCVIDTGKHREMRFDEKRQLSRLVETFIARSNAAQRRGRAGRVQEGLCFHLFTKQRHDTMLADHPLPEMMRLSLSDLALRIKILRVKIGTSIEDVLSRALDPPSAINIQRAVSSLVEVKALTPSEDITPMGRLLSKLPTEVHLGKFLLIAVILRCLDPALTIAATLNAKSPFVTPFGFEQEAQTMKNSFKTDNSDFLTIHTAFASWRKASGNGTPSFVREFCRKNYLSHQNLQQIEELRQQFIGYLVDADFIHVDRAYRKELSKARYRSKKTHFLNIPPELDANSGDSTMINVALGAGLYPKIITIDPMGGALKTISNNQSVSFHPSSVNIFGREFGVNHLCYFTIMHSKKLYVWETSPVDDLTLLLMCGDPEFKLLSDSAFIDRTKVKFKTAPKTNVALKYLRDQLTSILSMRMRGKDLTDSQKRWNNLAMNVLARVKVVEER